MLQQTQVKTVIPYWNRWMDALPSISSAARAPEERILKLWEGLGYYRRARSLQQAARQIENDHGGRFPSNLSDILALSGIGRYTAGAISSIAFNTPSPLVDGNVVRVLTRLFALSGNPKEKALNQHLWALAQSLVLEATRIPNAPPMPPRLSAGSCSELNQGLMELGATVCTPTTPSCHACPLSTQCRGFETGRPERFPEIPARRPPIHRRFVAFIVESGDRVLVQQRPKDGINNGLWEFPNQEIPMDGEPTSNPVPAFTIIGPFAQISHSITRYRIHLEAHRASLPPNTTDPSETTWKTRTEIAELPFTSAHGKLRALLLKGRIQP